MRDLVARAGHEIDLGCFSHLPAFIEPGAFFRRDGALGERDGGVAAEQLARLLVEAGIEGGGDGAGGGNGPRAEREAGEIDPEAREAAGELAQGDAEPGMAGGFLVSAQATILPSLIVTMRSARLAISASCVTTMSVALALPGDGEEHVGDHGAGGAVEIAGGFVGEDDAGVAGEGAGDGDALAFAAGELAGIVVHALGEADGGERRAGEIIDIGEAGDLERGADIVERVHGGRAGGRTGTRG